MDDEKKKEQKKLAQEVKRMVGHLIEKGAQRVVCHTMLMEACLRYSVRTQRAIKLGE